MTVLVQIKNNFTQKMKIAAKNRKFDLGSETTLFLIKVLEKNYYEPSVQLEPSSHAFVPIFNQLKTQHGVAEELQIFCGKNSKTLCNS